MLDRKHFNGRDNFFFKKRVRVRIYQTWQKRYKPVLNMLSSQLKAQNMHRYTAGYSLWAWAYSLGSQYNCRKKRKKQREKWTEWEKEWERVESRVSFLSLSAPCLPHPPSLLHPWDVDASRGQLPTDTSSWAARQALTALIQTNDAGVEVAGLPLSLSASSPAAWPCTALANHTQMKKKATLKTPLHQPPSFKKNTFISSGGWWVKGRRGFDRSMVGGGGGFYSIVGPYPLR